MWGRRRRTQKELRHSCADWLCRVCRALGTWTRCSQDLVVRRHPLIQFGYRGFSALVHSGHRIGPIGVRRADCQAAGNHWDCQVHGIALNWGRTPASGRLIVRHGGCELLRASTALHTALLVAAGTCFARSVFDISDNAIHRGNDG